MTSGGSWASCPKRALSSAGRARWSWPLARAGSVLLSGALAIGCRPAPPTAEMVALIMDATTGSLREETAPLLTGRSISIDDAPAAVEVKVSALGRARTVETRTLGEGPSAVRLRWRWGESTGSSWLPEGEFIAAGLGTLRFGGRPIPLGRSAVVTLEAGDFLVQCWKDGVAGEVRTAIPGQDLALGDLHLTLDAWLPSSEARHMAVPAADDGSPAAEVSVVAPEGTRAIWLLIDDPLSYAALGDARILLRSIAGVPR